MFLLPVESFVEGAAAYISIDVLVIFYRDFNRDAEMSANVCLTHPIRI